MVGTAPGAVVNKLIKKWVGMHPTFRLGFSFQPPALTHKTKTHTQISSANYVVPLLRCARLSDERETFVTCHHFGFGFCAPRTAISNSLDSESASLYCFALGQKVDRRRRPSCFSRSLAFAIASIDFSLRVTVSFVARESEIIWQFIVFALSRSPFG